MAHSTLQKESSTPIDSAGDNDSVQQQQQQQQQQQRQCLQQSRSAISKLISSQPLSVQSSPTTTLALEVLHNLRHQHRWTDLKLEIASSTATAEAAAAVGGEGREGREGVFVAQEKGGEQNGPAVLNLVGSRDDDDAATIASTGSSTTLPTVLISGYPPKTLYIHPDFQIALLKAGISPSAPHGSNVSGSFIANGAINPPIEREWVLPTTLARQWTLRELCSVFDALPVREMIEVDVDIDENRGCDEENTNMRRNDSTKAQKSNGEMSVAEVAQDVSGEYDDDRDDNYDNKNHATPSSRLNAVTTAAAQNNPQEIGINSVLPPLPNSVSVGNSSSSNNNNTTNATSDHKANKTKNGRPCQPRQRKQTTTITHQDAKRVLLAMKAPDGYGGDGTIVYYIMHEGEVKPRQN